MVFEPWNIALQKSFIGNDSNFNVLSAKCGPFSDDGAKKMQQKQTTCNAAIQWRWFNEWNKWNLYTGIGCVWERKSAWIKIDGR